MLQKGLLFFMVLKDQSFTVTSRHQTFCWMRFVVFSLFSYICVYTTIHLLWGALQKNVKMEKIIDIKSFLKSQSKWTNETQTRRWSYSLTMIFYPFSANKRMEFLWKLLSDFYPRFLIHAFIKWVTSHEEIMLILLLKIKIINCRILMRSFQTLALRRKDRWETKPMFRHEWWGRMDMLLQSM